MGNEMGNNNTSEFREEDNKSTETEGKKKEHVLSNDVKHENQVAVQTPESKDYHEKETELAPDDPKAVAQTNGKEQEEIEVKQSEKENTSSLIVFSESSTDFDIKEKSHESSNRVFENSEDCAVPSTILHTAKKSINCLENEAESQEHTGLSDEELLQVGNEDEKATIEMKNNGAMDNNGTNESLCSDVDVSMPVDKCIILTESENGDSKHDGNQSDSEVDNETIFLTESNCENDEKEDLTVSAHDASSNGVLQVEGVKVTEESCNQNKASEELSRESEAISMVHWHENLEAEPNGNEKVDCETVSNEGRIELVPELVNLTPRFSIINGTYSKAELEDYKFKKEEPEKEQTFEIEAKAEAPVLAEDQQQKTAKECEDAQIREESASEVKLERSGKLLGEVQPPFDATNTSMETLIPEVEFPTEKHEEAEAEAVLLHASEIEVAMTETNCKNDEKEDPTTASHDSSSNGILRVEEMKITEESCNPNKASVEFLRESEANFMMVQGNESLAAKSFIANENEKGDSESVSSEGKTALVPEYEDAQVGKELDRNSELLREVAFPSDSTNTYLETLVPTVELPIEKCEEEEAETVLLHAPETAETLTKTNSSASENHSSEQHQEFKSSISETRDGTEAQEDVSSASNGLVPERSTTVEITQVPQCANGVMETVIEAKLLDQSNEQSEKVETSITERVEEQEGAARFSIESIPDSYNARAEMRKSPSFGIDLRIEARSEESDNTPLLYQNINTNEDDISLQNSIVLVEYNQQLLKDQLLPPEEKGFTLGRSDSEKSRTQFLEQQDSSEKDTTNLKNSPSSSKVAAIASKSKDKHKRRASLFTNCMCCTTVLN